MSDFLSVLVERLITKHQAGCTRRQKQPTLRAIKAHGVEVEDLVGAPVLKRGDRGLLICLASINKMELRDGDFMIDARPVESPGVAAAWFVYGGQP